MGIHRSTKIFITNLPTTITAKKYTFQCFKMGYPDQTKCCNVICTALVLSIVGFVIDVLCSLIPYWAIWIKRDGASDRLRHDGLFADCGDPNWLVQCRFYDSGKFMKTPIWLFVVQLAAMFSIATSFISIILLIMEYREMRRLRLNACAWLLLIAGLLVCAQVIIYGGAGAWFYGIRFTDMGKNINDRIFGYSFYVQLFTGPILLAASAIVFHNVKKMDHERI